MKEKKQYAKIGCSATYLIRTDNLSDYNKKQVNKFKTKVNSCVSHYNKALAYSAASGVGIGVIMGLVIANVAFPPSVIVSIVVAALGGGSSILNCVVQCIDANDAYKSAGDYYSIIKGLGKKM